VWEPFKNADQFKRDPAPSVPGTDAAE